MGQIDYAKKLEELKAQQQREMLEETVKRGRCDLNPFPKPKEGEEDPQLFRVPILLERRPIYVVRSFQGEFFRHERQVFDPDTRRLLGVERTTVGLAPSKRRKRQFYGPLKTVHMYAFDQIGQLWAKETYPLGPTQINRNTVVCGSLVMPTRSLVLALCGSDSAGDYDRTMNILYDLKETPIILEDTTGREGTSPREILSLIVGFTWSEKGEPTVKIWFSEAVTNAFNEKQVKPISWKICQELKGEGDGRPNEVAPLLYRFYDYQLYRRNEHRMSLTLLMERFGMPPQTYKSLRRQAFAGAVELLQGRSIQSGKYNLDVRFALDGKDYALEARRVNPLKS